MPNKAHRELINYIIEPIGPVKGLTGDSSEP